MASPSDDPKTQPIARKAPLGPEPEAEPRLERRRPRLVSIHGAQLGKRWEIAPCGVVIGRDAAQAGLVLNDPAVSARHWGVSYSLPILSVLASRTSCVRARKRACRRTRWRRFASARAL